MHKYKFKFSEVVHFTDRQLEATEAADNYDYILYGGAVGGGKSYWLRWYPIRFLIQQYQKFGLKNVVAGLFCEDYPSLYDRHLTKIRFEFPPWLGSLKDGSREFRLSKQFGGGALVFRNLDDPSKYQSAEFALVAIDELTKNKKDVFDFLRMRKRWPGVPRTKFIAGSNPGSQGHAWVKQLWMDGTFEPTELEADQFKYVPAKARDNPHLPEEYYKTLEGLPADWRRAYLEGDWDIFKGQFFTEFRRDRHVVEPFRIPDTWRKFGGLDFGSTNPFAFYWIAVDWDGNYWVYREYYQKGKTAADNATEIVRMNKQANDTLEMVVADRSIFAKQGYGETVGDILRRNGIGQPGTLIYMMEPSMGGKDMRISRAQLLKGKLMWDSKRAPKIRFFNTCFEAIRTIPSLVYDENKPEDVDTGGEDHAYDAITYILQKLEDVKVDKPLTRIETKLAQVKSINDIKLDTSLNSKYNEVI